MTPANRKPAARSAVTCRFALRPEPGQTSDGWYGWTAGVGVARPDLIGSVEEILLI